MDGKNNKIFDLEEAYNNFVANKIRFNKEQSNKIMPTYMFEQYYYRRNVLSKLVELCDILRIDADFIFRIFNQYIEINLNRFECFPQKMEVIFDFLQCLATLMSYDSTIREWYNRKEEEMCMLEKNDVHDMSIDEITGNKNILDILTEKGLL